MIFDKVLCKYCATEVKYTGGSTTNLTNHYNNHHMQQHKEKAGNIQPSIASAFGVVRKYPKSSSHYIMLQQRVAEYIIGDMKPFNTVQSMSFRNLCTSLDPKFDMPSKTTISEVVIPKMYKQTKSNVQDLLDACSALTVTADGWSSVAKQSYTTITAHFINKDWNLVNVGLQTRHTPESHTAENLKALFEAAFHEWNLHNKPVVGVVDNAKNITKAWILLQRQYINCFAHSMNLAVKRGLAIPAIKDTLDSVRKLVNHFHHSCPHTEALKNQQEMLNLPRHKLKMDVETRWNSTFDMVESVLASKEAIAQVLIGDKVHRNLTLSAEEVTVLEELRDILKPWKELTIEVSSEKDITVSLIAPIIHSLLNKELQEKPSDTDLAIQMKGAMKADLSKRYQEVPVKSFLHVASLLDPRFKKLSFLSPGHREAAHNNLEIKAVHFEEERAKIQKIKLEKPTQSSETPLPSLNTGNEEIPVVAKCEPSEASAASSPDAKRKKKSAFFDDFFGDLIITKVENSPPASQRFQEELKMYLSLDPVPSDIDVLDWWKLHAKQLPLISNIAKQILCTPATSTPSERAFSKAGTLISEKRSLLKPDKVDKVLFLNKNYFKFKKE